MTLEELPPVLVLHLKRFVFEKTGGCQKLSKNIDYPVDLEISKGMGLSHLDYNKGSTFILAPEKLQSSKHINIFLRFSQKMIDATWWPN